MINISTSNVFSRVIGCINVQGTRDFTYMGAFSLFYWLFVRARELTTGLGQSHTQSREKE
jgi:hypothetical protein